jgi:hypothetical protein
LEHVKSAGGDVLRLVESPEPNERVGQPEMAGDHLERASRQLSGTDGPIGCQAASASSCRAKAAAAAW